MSNAYIAKFSCLNPCFDKHRFGSLTACQKSDTMKWGCFAHFEAQEGSNLSRPKKQKKTVQERKQAAAQRQAEKKKRDDRITYIMMGVIVVIFVAFLVKFAFF